MSGYMKFDQKEYAHIVAAVRTAHGPETSVTDETGRRYTLRSCDGYAELHHHTMSTDGITLTESNMEQVKA